MAHHQVVARNYLGRFGSIISLIISFVLIPTHIQKKEFAEVQLIDATGRIVRTFETKDNQRFYTLTTLSHGVYMLVIHYLDGEIETKRIIIE